MAEKGTDSQAASDNKTDDGPPPAYPLDAPPPYPQQPGYPAQPGHQTQPGYQAPPGYPTPPGYQVPPGYQATPGYQAPPGYQVPSAYQPPSGYQGQPGYHGTPAGAFMVTTQPGPAFMVQPVPQAAPPDYQGLAWFACLCCCWPLGIVAILKSNDVRNSLARGDFNSARIASNSARNFAYLAIGLGVAFLVMYIIVMVMVFTLLSAR